MKKLAIVQSNYIPWKGYFDLIAAVDEFVLFDTAQFTKRDWRNRNRIKTADGLCWLTVPVRSKGRQEQTIAETEIDGEKWAASHWRSLQLAYSRAPHYGEVAAMLKPFYLDRHYGHLSALNSELLGAICRYVGITTKISHSREAGAVSDKTERLSALCRQAGADIYYSGPAARGYLDEAAMARQGIRVVWFDYDGYAEYPQLWGPFVHNVSMLDLLFNCGRNAARYMKYCAA